jgi:hypothetical protein
MKIANLLMAQRDASKRTKTPSIWQVFVNEPFPGGGAGDSVKRAV